MGRGKDHAAVRVGGNRFADGFIVKMKDHFLALNGPGGGQRRKEKSKAQAVSVWPDSRSWEERLHAFSRPRMVPVDEANFVSSMPIRCIMETNKLGMG